LALEIAATPLGWDDDRMSGLWNARADVTRLSAKLWITFVAVIGARGEQMARSQFFDKWKLVNVPSVPTFPLSPLSPPTEGT
jgi:hypothetical protein